VASVASPLQRRVRPTSRPRGRCDVQPWGEARRSGTEDGCCDGGAESGLGPEERRGVSGAQVAGCDQNESWRLSREGRGLGQPMGASGSIATRHSRALPDAGRALAGRWEKLSMNPPVSLAVRDHERRKPLSDDVVPELLDSRPNEMEFSGEHSESAATTG